MQLFVFTLLFFGVPNGKVPDGSYFPFDLIEVLADKFALLLVIAEDHVSVVSFPDGHCNIAERLSPQVEEVKVVSDCDVLE